MQFRSDGIGATENRDTELRQVSAQASFGALALSPNESHFDPSARVQRAGALWRWLGGTWMVQKGTIDHTIYNGRKANP